MSRCELTGKKAVSKNLVSHSNIKTKSRALPNVHSKKFYSLSLKRSFRLKVATHACRCIDKIGGIDIFLLRQAKTSLSPFALKLRRSLEKNLKNRKKH